MNKQLVLFGCGNVAEKNLHKQPAFIVDNNADMTDTLFHNIKVKHPSVLNGCSDTYQVIICTTSVSEVKQQLQAYGFTWGRDATVASLLAERMEMSDLEDTAFSFLISSGLPSSSETFSHGGIYCVRETADYPQVTKIHQGNTHGLIKEGEHYVFTSQGEGILFLSKDFKLVHQIPLKSALRPHGLRKYGDYWVLVSSYQDAIIGVDAYGKKMFEHKLSDKINDYGSAQHHCNDLFIINDFAFVSMFSITGNYKRNRFDGGIVEINLKTGERRVLINGLTMPHSVVCDNDGFKVLNSFKGTLLGDNFEILATLPGFVRGFDTDSSYFYLGESKNRNFSRLQTGRSPVSIDSKITIVNKAYGFSRSVPLPRFISEIHALIALG
jgi:hypothetical protein